MMIIENNYFMLKFSEECLVPGYLILFLKGDIYAVHELDKPGREVLIHTLAVVQQTIKKIIQPERIYTLSIGEIEPRLHFHIFPRTQALLQEYQSEYGFNPVRPINGLALFEWARKKYKTTAYDHLEQKNAVLLKALKNVLLNSK